MALDGELGALAVVPLSYLIIDRSRPLQKLPVLGALCERDTVHAVEGKEGEGDDESIE